MSIDRRGFIQGLLTSVAGTTAMVTLATPAEAQALAVREKVVMRQPETIPMPASSALGHTAYIHSDRGDYIPIGLIDSLNVDCGVERIVSWNGQITLVPSFLSGDARYSGPF